MTIKDIIKNHVDKKVLAIGFYGAGNFGDELLCEMVINMFKDSKKLFLSYSDFENFPNWHNKQNNTELVKTYNPIQLIKHIFRTNSIIIGGGGLWSKDSNKNTVLLSLILLISRFIFRKKVYLLGVGYYKDANRYGKVGAKLSVLAANHILPRDKESYVNFSASANKTKLTKIDDLAYQYKNYKDRYTEKINIPIKNNTILFSIRGSDSQTIKKSILNRLKNRQENYIYLSFYDPSGEVNSYDKDILSLSKIEPNLEYVEFNYNPMDLIKELNSKRSKIKGIIMPQFHGIIMADIIGINFMPIFYSNKNKILFEELGIEKPLPLSKITRKDINGFIDSTS